MPSTQPTPPRRRGWTPEQHARWLQTVADTLDLVRAYDPLVDATSLGDTLSQTADELRGIAAELLPFDRDLPF